MTVLTWRIVILLYQEAQRRTAEDVVHKMVKRAVELEGTVTVSSPIPSLPLLLIHKAGLLTAATQGEHGVGLVKRDYLPHELGQDTVDAMRRLKLAFDPLCLLNPDKIIRLQQPKKGEIAPW
jgi:D-lactate dehydrogenase (cytochrome)